MRASPRFLAPTLFAIVLVALCSAPATTSARTWHIQPDGSGDAPTIQAGIDSSAAGDTVLVACGTFFEHDIALKSGICLRGEASRCATVDAGLQGRVMVADHLVTQTYIEGFVIRGGSAGGDWESSRGGGILVDHESVVTIRDCFFTENWAEFGGGGFSDDYSVTVVEGCDFVSNIAVHWGGGFVAYNDSSMVRDCRFRQNAANHGGALDCSWGNGEIVNCSFRENTGLSGGAAYFYTYYGSITGCEFVGNTATEEDGGAFRLATYSTSTITGCLISGNVAARYGGGIYFERYSEPRVVGCTITGNSAPGGGSGVLSDDSYVEFESTIIAFNDGSAGLVCRAAASIDLTCSDVSGNSGGDWVGCIADQLGTNGNFWEDPLFCGAATGDFTLRSDSPCLPGQHPDGVDCDLIGAFGEGCAGPIAVEQTTWGGIKRMFR